MSIGIKRLSKHFVAEISGVDLTGAVDEETVRAIDAAFNEHSILVFHDQAFDDESQIAFTRRLGPLETTVSSNPLGAGTHIAVISNVDAEGNIIPPGDKRMIFNSGNEMWHTDSSFKPVPATGSFLSGREVPPEGGETEFCSLRAAYEALPEARKAWLEGKIAVHDFLYSRGLIDKTLLGEKDRTELPAVRHPLVRTNPLTGRKSLYIGAHASYIEGLPVSGGRAILKELLEHATQPEFVYRHKWRRYDAVMWDNRAALHRGRTWDKAKHRRIMHRTTLAGVGPTTEQPYATAAE